MTRLFRSLLVLLALLAFSTGGMWDVASAHPAKMHAVKTHAVTTQATGHHHAAADAHSVAANHSTDHAHHQPPQQAAGLNVCFDTGKPCGGDDRPDHSGSLCCAAMACHMAVLPQTLLTTSAVALRADAPLPLETTVEGTLGPRLERPPRSLAA